MGDKAEEKTKSSGGRTRRRARGWQPVIPASPSPHCSWLPQNSPTPTSLHLGMLLFPFINPWVPTAPSMSPELGQGHCQSVLGKRPPPEWVLHRSVGSTPGMDQPCKQQIQNSFPPPSLYKVSAGLGMFIWDVWVCVWRQKDGSACLVSETWTRRAKAGKSELFL